jgi:hypothetical protein
MMRFGRSQALGRVQNAYALFLGATPLPATPLYQHLLQQHLLHRYLLTAEDTMADPLVPPVPVQPGLPTVDNLSGVYIAARGPTRAEYLAMNDTLTRLAGNLTEAKLKDLIREGVREEIKDLTTKTNVDKIVKVSGKVDDVKVLLERMDYNNRMRSFNSARLSWGDLPLLPLLDVNGHHVNIRWVREIQDGTEQKILDWATRFDL